MTTHPQMSAPVMMTIPSRIARELARQIPVQILEPPIRIPTFAVSLVWHERTERDSAHQWVRTKLQSIAAELTKTDTHSRRARSG